MRAISASVVDRLDLRQPSGRTRIFDRTDIGLEDDDDFLGSFRPFVGRANFLHHNLSTRRFGFDVPDLPAAEQENGTDREGRRPNDRLPVGSGETEPTMGSPRNPVNVHRAVEDTPEPEPPLTEGAVEEQGIATSGDTRGGSRVTEQADEDTPGRGPGAARGRD